MSVGPFEVTVRVSALTVEIIRARVRELGFQPGDGAELSHDESCLADVMFDFGAQVLSKRELFDEALALLGLAGAA